MFWNSDTLLILRIDFKNKKLEDPLSVTLSLTESEKQDERIGISIKRMLEEYVW